MQFQDQLNRVLLIEKTPKRIISLVPSQTELLCDLGLENSVVGITKFCVHPKRLKRTKSVVGGTKQIHLDKIKALEPDIILCNKEENTLAIVEELESIAPIHISDIFTIEDCLELITMYGALFNRKSESKIIISAIKEKQQDFQAFVESQVSLTSIYFIWKNPWMIAANNTFINFLLELNKFQNSCSTLERYPEIKINSDAYKNVDLVLLSSEPFPFKENHVAELQPNFPNAKIILVDGEMFSWYGSRLTKAFDYFKSLRNTINS